MGVPPEVVPENAGWPVSGLLSALRQPAALAAVTGLPMQKWARDAEHRDHYASGDKTRANGGAGRAPGRGKGVVDPAPPPQEAPKKWTAPEKSGAGSFDAKTSERLPKKSTALIDEFKNADGSITRQIHKSRTNYRAADGSYQPIDTTLIRRGDRLEMGANSIDVTLGARGADDSAPSSSVSPSAAAIPSTQAAPPAPRVKRVKSADEALASVTTASGHTMAYDLAGAADVAAVVDGSTATYPEILPDTDLELRTVSDGLKETIVLNTPAAGNEWVFPLRLEGLTAREMDDGSLELVAADGKVAMYVPAGYMQDSKVDPQSGLPARSWDVEYDLITVDGGQALKVTADAAWLNDPARQYPVRIDPTTWQTKDTGDIFVDNNDATKQHNGDDLPVGTYNSGTHKSRSFIHFDEFDNDGLTGTQIKSAKLFLFHTWSYNCTSHEPVYVRRITEPWTVASMEDNGTLAKGPSYSGAIGTMTITNNYPACENTGSNAGKGAWRSVSLNTATFNAWSSGSMPNYGLALTASETDSTAFKRFTSGNYGDSATDPYLEVTYDYNEPPQVNEQYPAYGQAVRTLSPELLADAHDADNWPKSLKYEFIFYDKDAKTQVFTSGAISKKSWIVPAGKLKWGESYYWTVKVSDGLLDNAKYLTKHLLVTPVPQPSITSGLSQNAEQGFDSVIGNYTTSSRDAMINTVGPALEVVRSYNSIDPRVGQAFGAGWSSVVDAKAVEANVTGPSGTSVVNTVVVTYPNGRELAFGRNHDGTFSSPAGRAATFTAIGTEGYRLVEKDGTTYDFLQKVATGRFALKAIKDVSGREETFAYNNNLLTTIKSASGRTLDFYWSETTPKHVEYVATDPVTPGDWDSVNTWWYQYTDNSLTKVCPPTNWGDCHAYQYTSGSLFQTAVDNSKPHSYWRLTETSGTTAESSVLDNVGTDNGAYSNVTLGQPGPLAGSTATAAGFNGTSSQVRLPANLDGDSTNQAISMWFKTPNGAGDGVLYGQSWEPTTSTATTTKGAYNPTLYVGTDGKLVGGFPKAPKLGASLGTLMAYGQGQCLTVPGNSSANGVRLALANCTGAANQVFTWTATRELRVTTGGVVKCLDAEGEGFTNGVDVITYDCNGQSNQQWEVKADGQIVAYASGLCLDSVGTGLPTQLNAEMQIWACFKQRTADQAYLSRVHTPMQSTASVADNNWHHVVLSTTGNKQELYLDGNRVAVDETGVTVQDMSAVSSYVGSGFLGGGWPNQSHVNTSSNLGTKDHFNGSIAEVAYYDTAVDKAMVDDIWAARLPVRPLTRVIRPSTQSTAVVAYDGATGRVSQLTDGNGTAWKPKKPTVTKTTKVHESAVLSGAPTNYWRLSDTGTQDAVNEVNGGTATYNNVTTGSVPGPLGGSTTAATFNGSNSHVALPAGVHPDGTNSVSMWFNTTDHGPLLGRSETFQFLSIPTMWIDSDGELRGLSPSTPATGPMSSQVAGKCLDVQGGTSENSTPIQLYTCNGSAAQTWTIESGSSSSVAVRALDKCLDIRGGSTADGAAIQLYTCNGSAAQLWDPMGGGLRNPASGKCVSINPTSGKYVDGTDALLYPCALDRANGWKLGVASHKAVNDGKWHHAVLTTAGNTQTLYLDGTKIQWAGGRTLTPATPQPAYSLGTSGASMWAGMAGATRDFTGHIAEVAFYAAELDPTQISNQFKARNAAQSNGSGEVNYAVEGPKSTTTTTVYDLVYSRKIADVDALGNMTRYGYSGKGHLRTVTDPMGNMTINEHDVRGNVVAATTCQDRSENKCSTSYTSYYPDATTENPAPNLINDRVMTQRGFGSTSATDDTYLTTYTYDGQGNRIGMVDPLKGKTTIAYTDGTTAGRTAGGYGADPAPANLPWRVVKPDGGVQTILYYPSGDVAETTDPAGMVTRYEYDGLGRTTKEIEVVAGVAGPTTTFAHDRLDRVVTVTNAAVTNAVNGDVHTPVTSLTYNVDGLLTSEVASDATGGDASRTVTYGYDGFGRRVTETDELGNTVETGYDEYGRVNRQKHADDSTVRTEYDALGNELATIVEGYIGDPHSPSPAANLTVRSMTYDKAGRLASEFVSEADTDGDGDEDGYTNDYTYTDNNLLASVTRRDPETGASFLMERNTYDAAGNVIKQVTNNGQTTTTRTYDAAGRSTAATLDLPEEPGDQAGARDRTTAYRYSFEDEVIGTTLSEGSTVLGRSEAMFDRLGRLRQQTTYLSDGLTPTMRWKMDQTSGPTTADSAGNNTGEVNGAVTWSSERGGSASFNGSSASIIGQPVVNAQQPYTVSAWVNLGARDLDRHVLGMAGDIGSSALKLFFNKTTETWQIAMAVRNPDASTTWLNSSTTVKAASNAWTHLAVTVDPVPANRTATLYVDGTATATISTTKDFNNRATGLRIGSETDTTGAFSGRIDDVQAYQKVLTPAEVGQLKSGAAPANDARVSRTTYGLTEDGSIKSVTDPRGNTAYITNDEVGRAVVTSSPAVNTVVEEGAPALTVSETLVGYNTFGEVTEQQDANDKVTTFRYDGVGQLVESELPSYTPKAGSAPIVAKTTAEYNEVGQVVATTDPLNATTRYEYDQFGRTVKVTAPDSGITRYSYSINGDVLRHTDPNGASVGSTYDYLGRTLKSTQAVRQASASYSTEYAYGTNGESPWPTKVTSPGRVTTQATYNAAGEQVTVTDGATKVTKMRYDGAGRPVRTTAPDQTYTTVAYDFAGRALSTSDYSKTDVLLRTRSQRYDAAGNTVAATDAYNREKTFTYDAAGRLESQREPISGSDAIVTRFGYDKAGNQTRFSNDDRGTNFITTYNEWGLPAKQIEPATAGNPNDRTFTMLYDAGGRLTRMESPGGVTVTSDYDVMGRLKRSSGTGAQVATTDREYEYDQVGRMTSFTGSAGKNTVQYDDRGLITSIAGVSGASSYTYNDDGALATRVDGAGTTSYGYDEAGRLKTLANATAGISQSYGYDETSQVTSISYGGGNKRSLGYNDLHQLETDEVKTSAEASIGKIAYEWDRNDNLTKKTTTGFNGASTNTYSYDFAGRMIGWDNGVTPVVYAYDKAGNRVQAGAKTFTYNERNQLVSDSAGTTYQYTARGTLAATTVNGQQTNTVTDAFNQVVSQGAKNGSTASYTYDGLGRMIQPSLKYTGLSNDIAADGTSVYVRDVADGLVGVASGSTYRYAWTDIHDDVVGEFAGNGTALTGSVSYDPWGKILAGGGMVGKLGYQSEWTDQGTGKVNMWSRWYDPETGAFDTRDTATNSPTPTSGAANRYAYAEGDPLGNTDTTGNAVDGKCGEYDFACAMKKYQAQLADYTSAMDQRDRDMKAAGGEIARQEADFQRAERESQTPLLDILLQVGIGMLLDMIGYNAIVGCIGGSIWDCVDLASNFLGPIKALKLAKSLYRAVDRAFSGYRMWKRVVEGARTVMRHTQNLLQQARKHLNDVMQKLPKKPKMPKKKKKPPTKKKPKPKKQKQEKPKASTQATKPKPQTKARNDSKPNNAKPKKQERQQERQRDRDRDRDEPQEADRPETASCHSFDPATRVLMADGTIRPISEVNVGDEVRAKDPATGDEGARQVTELHSNRDIELTDVTVSDRPAGEKADKSVGEGKGGRSTRGPTEAVLETTAYHPFWDATAGKWVDAADLVEGKSTLVGPDGEIQYVIDVHAFDGSKVMRDLTVAEIHTYYVIAGNEPVLVHNCGSDDELQELANELGDTATEYQKLAGTEWDVQNKTSAAIRAQFPDGKGGWNEATVVGSSGDGMSLGQISLARRKGHIAVEDNIEGLTHAEHNILLRIHQMGGRPIAGAASRSVCRPGPCGEMIRATAGRISGQVYSRERGFKIRTFYWPGSRRCKC
ncbi:hypothetical protein Adi01nite_37900 [Amorphoplanes digitatis]|nr:hypothetical protein Adi01nite_37900 [Actinoplanes digitatis]